MLRLQGLPLPRQSSAICTSFKRVDFVYGTYRNFVLSNIYRRHVSVIQRPTKSGTFLSRNRLGQAGLPLTSGYPERLLIYHAGTGKTVFVGCLKLTTIFLFSFSCLFVAPSLYYAPDVPNWAPALGQSRSFGTREGSWVNRVVAIAGGAVPMVFVAYTTTPFVSYVHLRLPIFARKSREQLFRWARNIPPNTEIDLTTIRSFGRPRVSRMQISDLQATSARLGVANLARRPRISKTETPRPWWRGKPQGLFYVGNDTARSREPSLWQKVLEVVKAS